MSLNIVEQINDLLSDRTFLRKENASEIVKKLTDKRDTLKENFILNLPFNYNNEQEFSDLFQRIDFLTKDLTRLKSEKKFIESKLKEVANDTEAESSVETELEPIILKSIQIKRHMAYIRCLIKAEELKKGIEANIASLIRMQDEEAAQKLKLKDQKMDKRMTDKIDQLEKTRSLDQKILIEATIIVYKELRNLVQSIRTTQCVNLVKYICESIKIYHKQLKSLLTNKIEDKLKSISYPFISNDGTQTLDLKRLDSDQPLKHIRQESENILKFCIDCLLDIELLTMLEELAVNKHLKGFELASENSSNKSTVIGILVKPFETRFKFHFMGSRKTNNYEKPEWFLSQIIKWIRGHEEFINTFIQPIFENYNMYKRKPIIIDFTNSLINLIKIKINTDLPILIKNKFQFSHSVDELLLFDTQLKNYLKEFMLYDSRYFYGCLNILCENELLFSTWINLERQVCQKKLDLMFVNNLNGSGSTENSQQEASDGLYSLSLDKQFNDVWSCDYSDIDKMKPPHCAESFMAMIKAITERFNELPYQTKKLQFVSLQIELINDFHLRICQITRDEAKTPFGRVYLGALNAVNYIMNILDEWKNSKFYIEMDYLKLRYTQLTNKQKEPKLNSNVTENQNLMETDSEQPLDNHLENEDVLSNKFDQKFLNGESIFDSFHSFVDINGTLFDSVLSSYEKIKDEMMLTVISNCLWEIKTRSRNYRREKWISMPLFTEFYKVTLTQSAADMLISMKNLIFLLKDSLAQVLFETILKRLAAELDKFLFDEIILKNQFNEGGVSQFDHDFTKYILPILNEFSVDSKSESFFRKTKEALILLKLKQGSALLAKEIIGNALHQESSIEVKKAALYNAKNALKEFGVIQLTCEVSEEILSLRLY